MSHFLKICGEVGLTKAVITLFNQFYQKDSIFFHYCRHCLFQVILNFDNKFILGLGFYLASCDFRDFRGVDSDSPAVTFFRSKSWL